MASFKKLVGIAALGGLSYYSGYKAAEVLSSFQILSAIRRVQQGLVFAIIVGGRAAMPLLLMHFLWLEQQAQEVAEEEANTVQTDAVQVDSDSTRKQVCSDITIAN